MSRVGRVAGAVTVAEGAWPLYVVFVARPFAQVIFCPVNLCPAPTFIQSGVFGVLFPALGILLLGAGGLGAWGARWAYQTGAVLSAILLAVSGYAYLTDIVAGAGSTYASSGGVLLYEIAAIVLSAVGVGVNFLATRGRKGLPEQANPMNLPVFG